MSAVRVGREPELPAPAGWVELARRPVALFLDVDGTLLEFEDHPDDVRATEALVALLRAVEDALGGALAVISGRPLDDLDRVFAPWRPVAAGIHGVEVRHPGGERRHEDAASVTDEVRREVSEIVAHAPQCWVEDKGASLAVHYRNAPTAGSALSSRLAALAARQGLDLLDGVFVLELRPSGHHKGTAVAELMQDPPFAGRLPVVVGDDTTDEDAFRVVQAMGGLAVVVGSRPGTVATAQLSDPAAVRGWLAQLIEEVRG